MNTLCRSVRWKHVAGLVVVLVAGGLRAETEAEIRQKQADLHKEFEDGVAVVVQLYPSADENGSPMNKAMAALDGELKAANSPVYNSGEKALIVACLAAKRLGVRPSEQGALTAQAFTDVERRYPDLYGMTSWFSEDFWRMAQFVRHLEPEAVFRDMPDGAAIANAIRTLHPRYAEQWPLVCMAFVESHTADLQQKMLTQKMQHIIFPQVTFNGATVAEALEYMRVKSKDLDPEHVGVNLIVKTGLAPTGQISLTLTDAPFEDALRYVTELAGLKYKVEADSVVVVPASEKSTYHSVGEGYKPIGSDHVPIGGVTAPKRK